MHQNIHKFELWTSQISPRRITTNPLHLESHPQRFPCCQIGLPNPQGPLSARRRGGEVQRRPAISVQGVDPQVPLCSQGFSLSFSPNGFPQFFLRKSPRPGSLWFFDPPNLGEKNRVESRNWSNLFFFPRFSKSSKLRKHPGDFRVYFPCRERNEHIPPKRNYIKSSSNNELPLKGWQGI